MIQTPRDLVTQQGLAPVQVKNYTEADLPGKKREKASLIQGRNLATIMQANFVQDVVRHIYLTQDSAQNVGPRLS